MAAYLFLAQQRLPRPERVFRDRTNPFDLYSPEAFRLRYRLKKETTQQLIEEVRANLVSETQRNKAISPELQVLVFLRFLASSQFYNSVGDLHGISSSSVCRILKRVSDVVASLHGNYINMPPPEDIHRTKRAFYEVAGFPGVIGLIDCTHIKLVFNVPPGNAGNYFNRKQFYSINVQIVSDNKYRILDIVARWPGSVHDSRIWNNSRICADLEAGRFNGYILGDSGYPCTPTLLTPLRNVHNPAEVRYNRAHITTRSAVERSFAHWKRRFPILHYGLRMKLENVPHTIVAAAVIHNIAINNNEIEFVNDDIFEDNDNAEHDYEGNDARGNVFRRRLIERVFN